MSVNIKNCYWRPGVNTSAIELSVPNTVSIALTEDTLTVELDDERTISVPLSWYPRLFHANAAERNNWKLIGRGAGIHWVDIDEDISIEGLIAGKPSNESRSSLKKWMARLLCEWWLFSRRLMELILLTVHF